MADNPGALELLSKARNTRSQTGEDGIVEAILERLPERDQWCVEFGAWDGVHLSNTCRLIEEKGYSAVLIEAGEAKFGELVANMKPYPSVTCLNAFVGFTGEDSLDALLSGTSCPEDFDFLSIDIDGNDYHVWKVVSTYHPKLVCIEYNPAIPSAVRYVQPADMSIQQGNSLRAYFELGQEKGYKLVCANLFNAFFVREDLWDGEYVRTADELPAFRLEEPASVYLFSGFDGTILLSEPYDLVTHKYILRDSDVQVMPRFLRRFPDKRNVLQRLLYGIHSRWRRHVRGL